MSLPLDPQIIQTQIVPNCGALVLAMAFSAVFYGITILQTYMYYDKYGGDSVWIKIFVAVLWLLDTAQMASVIDTVWFYVISNYGNPASLAIYASGVVAEIITTISIGLVVQSFFAMRVWLTSGDEIEHRRKVLIPTIIVALSFAQWGFGMYYAAVVQKTHQTSVLPKLAWAASTGLGCSIAGDFLITLTLCYNLHKSRSGVKKTDKLINVLIVYTVNTGLLTSMVATCAIILSNVFATSFWLLLPFCLVSKSYVNSALATLNAREKLRKMSASFTVGTRDAAQVEINQFRITKSTTVVHDGRDSTSDIHLHNLYATRDTKMPESILATDVV
ncbi:hypothetical protein OBBRIDRAFT_794805 [Obba rivulosa]|uniref:DUF6534 domain-containing protein n=1 Tax=Obba rivulosa TaxID=1052685 RepID=A0A8E2DJ41_9APHY|nr:hypothetical protein OBBRIDRAFT_794805 [Obba rivulosa]